MVIRLSLYTVIFDLKQLSRYQRSTCLSIEGCIYQSLILPSTHLLTRKGLFSQSSVFPLTLTLTLFQKCVGTLKTLGVMQLWEHRASRLSRCLYSSIYLFFYRSLSLPIQPWRLTMHTSKAHKKRPCRNCICKQTLNTYPTHLIQHCILQTASKWNFQKAQKKEKKREKKKKRKDLVPHSPSDIAQQVWRRFERHNAPCAHFAGFETKYSTKAKNDIGRKPLTCNKVMNHRSFDIILPETTKMWVYGSACNPRHPHGSMSPKRVVGRAAGTLSDGHIAMLALDPPCASWTPDMQRAPCETGGAL